ncbi:MAG: sensor histidine kinase [Cyanobacteria bacterium]|nr:sensor histidine kinase [Cyanobacteriota bacterium]
MKKSILPTILLPLMVLLLLTLIVGYTAYKQTTDWEAAYNVVVEESQQTRSERFLLARVVWHLEEAARSAGNQTERNYHWQKARVLLDEYIMKQPLPLQGQRPGEPLPLLWAFLQQDANNSAPKINHFLSAVVLTKLGSQPLSSTSAQDLKAHSQEVTFFITASMMALGMVLITLTTLDISRLVRELAASRDLNTRIQEDERRRIAQELHDDVIQSMIDLKRDLNRDKTLGKIERLLDAMRRICNNLKPQILDDLGFAAALEFLAKDLEAQTGGSVRLSMEADHLEALPKELELPVFRAIQELLSNTKRHARATQVNLTVVFHPEESPLLRIYLTDNGCGFNPEIKNSGLGLTGVRERILQLGGSFQLESTPGKGTQVHIRVNTAR